MSRAASRRPGLGRVLAKASSTWTSIGVAGSALVAAAAFGSWPILALGGLAYGALVAMDLASPDFWRKALGQAGAPEAASLPSPEGLGDEELAGAVRKILAARTQLARVLADTPAEIQANLAVAIAQVAELERHAATLVDRGAGLARYLAHVDPRSVRAEVESLAGKARAARDPEARTGYEAAQAEREEQLRVLVDLEGARDRVAAQLASIVAALEGLPPKLVRMRALDAQAMDELTGSVSEELARMNGEVRVFEETLRGLAEVKVR